MNYFLGISREHRKRPRSAKTIWLDLQGAHESNCRMQAKNSDTNLPLPNWCDMSQRECVVAEITKHFLTEHGPIIGADKVWRIMGFNTADSFKASFHRGRVKLPLFRIDGRKGLFILAPVLAQQIVELAAVGQVDKLTDISG